VPTIGAKEPGGFSLDPESIGLPGFARAVFKIQFRDGQSRASQKRFDIGVRGPDSVLSVTQPSGRTKFRMRRFDSSERHYLLIA